MSDFKFKTGDKVWYSEPAGNTTTAAVVEDASPIDVILLGPASTLATVQETFYVDRKFVTPRIDLPKPSPVKPEPNTKVWVYQPPSLRYAGIVIGQDPRSDRGDLVTVRVVGQDVFRSVPCSALTPWDEAETVLELKAQIAELHGMLEGHCRTIRDLTDQIDKATYVRVTELEAERAEVLPLIAEQEQKIAELELTVSEQAKAHALVARKHDLEFSQIEVLKSRARTAESKNERLGFEIEGYKSEARDRASMIDAQNKEITSLKLVRTSDLATIRRLDRELGEEIEHRWRSLKTLADLVKTIGMGEPKESDLPTLIKNLGDAKAEQLNQRRMLADGIAWVRAKRKALGFKEEDDDEPKQPEEG